MILYIFCPIYISIDEEDLKKAIRFYIKRLISDLEVAEIEVRSISDRYVQICIEGEDARIARNYLIKVMGTRFKLGDVVVGGEYNGRVYKTYEDRIYVDIGLEPPTYVEVKTHTLLAKILGTYIPKPAISQIFRIVGISKNFPIAIKITNKTEKERIILLDGVLGRRTTAMFRKWLQDRLDRVITYGTLRSRLDKKLRKSGLYRRIVKVERLGLLEHAIVCKFGQFADEIAQKLTDMDIPKTSIFMPRKIRKLINYYKNRG